MNPDLISNSFRYFTQKGFGDILHKRAKQDEP